MCITAIDMYKIKLTSSSDVHAEWIAITYINNLQLAYVVHGNMIYFNSN